MKKTALLLFLISVMLLAACGRNTETDPVKESTTGSSAETDAKTSEHASSDVLEKKLSFETLYKDGKALDAETLKEIGSFMENDHQPLPWSFLGQEYRDLSEIDVIDLFYNWNEGLDGEEEQEAAWKAGNMTEMRLETQKRTVKGMKEAFQKYTGKDFTKEQEGAFSIWIYLPEYDAYYSFLTDSNRPKVTLGRACYVEEKEAAELGLKDKHEQLIALEWTAADSASPEPASAGMLLLAPFEGGWQIVANIFE